MVGESNNAFDVTVSGRRGQICAVRQGEPTPRNAEMLSPPHLALLRSQTLSKYPLHISWPLSLGMYGVFGVSALSCTAITFMLRQRLNLAHSGLYLMRSYIAPVVACTSSAQLYNLVIADSILAGDIKCEICKPLRASLLNLTTGFAMPGILVLYSTIYSARVAGTYRNLPKFSEYNALYKEMKVATKGCGKILYLCMLACAAMPFFFAWKTQQLIEDLHSGQLDIKNQSEFSPPDSDLLSAESEDS